MNRIQTEGEFLDWKAHPGTQQFREFLRKGREILKDQWEAGVFQSSKMEETHAANLQALGSIQQLNELIDLDYEQFVTTLTGEPPEKDPTDDTQE